MAFEYTTLDQVRAMLPKDVPITVESKPSIIDVSAWITGAEARVDVALAAGAATSPATDTQQKAAAGMLCAGEVAYRVQLTRSGGGDDFEKSAWARLDDTFEKALLLMEKGTWVADAGTGMVPPSSRTMNATDDSSADSIQPKFTRDQVHNW